MFYPVLEFINKKRSFTKIEGGNMDSFLPVKKKPNAKLGHALVRSVTLERMALQVLVIPRAFPLEKKKKWRKLSRQ